MWHTLLTGVLTQHKVSEWTIDLHPVPTANCIDLIVVMCWCSASSYCLPTPQHYIEWDQICWETFHKSPRGAPGPQLDLKAYFNISEVWRLFGWSFLPEGGFWWKFCMIFFHEPNLLYLVTKVDDDQMELKEAYLWPCLILWNASRIHSETT